MNGGKEEGSRNREYGFETTIFPSILDSELAGTT